VTVRLINGPPVVARLFGLAELPEPPATLAPKRGDI
jgi:hypothetical protein